ncbi:hypothetical protein [Bacillus massilinigeriensis]|uniref:hypothetical protein n=1 Tax=Bacillus mediterraneensis TaxID=1805474 RepID=UPI0008F900D7|nr:hypothetical protein [Bacillus mediterraneensis]
MAPYMSILTLISIGLLLGGVFYTTKVVAIQRKAKRNLDDSIPEKVQEKPYMRNPIFLAFFLFFFLAVLFIMYSQVIYR